MKPTLCLLSLGILTAIPKVASAQTAGSPDLDFNGTGIVVVPSPAPGSGFWGTAVQSDDKVVVAGSELISSSDRRWLIQRYATAPATVKAACGRAR